MTFDDELEVILSDIWRKAQESKGNIIKDGSYLELCKRQIIESATPNKDCNGD